MLFPSPQNNPLGLELSMDEKFSIPHPDDANLDWSNPSPHYGTHTLLSLPRPPHTLLPTLGCSHSLWVTHTIRLSPVLNHCSKSFNLNWLPFALPGTDLPGHSQHQAARLLHQAQAGVLACLCLSLHLCLRACDSLPVLPYPPQGSLQSSCGIRFCLRLMVWLWFVPEKIFLWSTIGYKSVLSYCVDESHEKWIWPIIFYTTCWRLKA